MANHDQVTAQHHNCQSAMDRLIQAVDEQSATAWQWYCDAVDRAGIKADGCKAGRVLAPARTP